MNLNGVMAVILRFHLIRYKLWETTQKFKVRPTLSVTIM